MNISTHKTQSTFTHSILSYTATVNQTELIRVKLQTKLESEPLPIGCGTTNPGRWKRESELDVVGRSSVKPQVVRDPTNKTRLRRACTDSSFSSCSSLQTQSEAREVKEKERKIPHCTFFFLILILHHGRMQRKSSQQHHHMPGK